MVVGWTITYAINVYYHRSYEFESCSWIMYSMQYYIIITLWFSPASPVSSSNTIDSHDKAEILLKVALNTITLTHIRTNNIYFRTSTIWDRTARYYPYGSGIYIYICTNCHSLFGLWIRFSHMVRCARCILYYETILITVVREFLSLLWYVAHQKRENNLEFWSNVN